MFLAETSKIFYHTDGSTFFINKKGSLFRGYEAEDIIIWEDAKPKRVNKFGYSGVLGMFEPYPSNSQFENKILKKIWIVNNRGKTLDEFIDDILNEDYENTDIRYGVEIIEEQKNNTIGVFL